MSDRHAERTLRVDAAREIIVQQGRIKRLDKGNGALARAVLDARGERDAALGVEHTAIPVPMALATFAMAALILVCDFDPDDLDYYVDLRAAAADFGRAVRPSIVEGDDTPRFVRADSIARGREAITELIDRGISADRENAVQCVTDLSALLDGVDPATLTGYATRLETTE